MKLQLSLDLTTQNDVIHIFWDLFSEYSSEWHHIPLSKIFDLTPEFQAKDAAEDHLLVTSSSEVLKMIGTAVNIENSKINITYIGESSLQDPQMDYFVRNNHENVVLQNVLAEQIHLLSGVTESPLSLRLGALKENFSESRIYLSDSSYIFFNINAIKWSDAPAQSSLNPSGITSEMANQIAYLAGQSPRNKYFIIYGIENPDRDPYHITFQTIAQMSWYFHYGATHKKLDWPIPSSQSQDFMIESKMIDSGLTYRKDVVTGNWYHKIPFPLPEFLKSNEWISSNLEEYNASANEDIPHRILYIYERLSELSQQS